MADRSGQMLVLNIIFMTLTTITVALRVYCRGWVVRSFGVDDHLMVVTWVCCAHHWRPQVCLEYTSDANHRFPLPHTSSLSNSVFHTGPGKAVIY